MDPSNRRFVWSFLEQFKKDRVIVLTTHSMEEADILGDKIAIMSRGRLRAVGKSIRLKNKFGSGYRISMIVPRGSQVPTVKSMISQECPEAVLDEEEFYGGGGGDGTAEKDVNKIAAADSEKTAASESKKIDDGQTARLVYAASSINVVKKLVVFLERITSDKENVGDGGSPLISSFGMSQTTLEDVFMRMVKEKSD
jgi:ABC-type multidrug transport system ATPase subunit